MRKMVRGVLALAMAAAAVTAIGATGAQAPDGSWDRCLEGAVCVYPQNADAATASPTYVFWSYGAHNLSNQVGRHWVLNNRTGGAHAHLCSGYNGAGCGYDIADDNGVYADLTPTNSITLDRP